MFGILHAINHDRSFSIYFTFVEFNSYLFDLNFVKNKNQYNYCSQLLKVKVNL